MCVVAQFRCQQTHITGNPSSLQHRKNATLIHRIGSHSEQRHFITAAMEIDNTNSNNINRHINAAANTYRCSALAAFTCSLLLDGNTAVVDGDFHVVVVAAILRLYFRFILFPRHNWSVGWGCVRACTKVGREVEQ